jgi:hypothetical protein
MNKKCTYCNKDFSGNSFPYYDRKNDKYAHTECYHLINNINSMDKESLIKLQNLIKKALKRKYNDK